MTSTSINPPRKVDLPYELEREIFDLAARAHLRCAPRLALVCRYVQEWVEATIYETIVLGTESSVQQLFWRTFGDRPPVFFATSIRALHLATGVSHNNARRILSVCRNLSLLTCWANPLTSREELIALLSLNPHLRRLSIAAPTLWDPMGPVHAPDVRYPLFKRVTHLEVVNPPSWFDWAPLLELPCLTHLAFGDLDASHAEGLPAFMQVALESKAPGPELEMLMVVSQNDLFLSALERAKIEDRRLVCLPSYHHPYGPTEYWDAVAGRDVQFWQKRGASKPRIVEAAAEL